MSLLLLTSRAPSRGQSQGSKNVRNDGPGTRVPSENTLSINSRSTSFIRFLKATFLSWRFLMDTGVRGTGKPEERNLETFSLILRRLPRLFVRLFYQFRRFLLQLTLHSFYLLAKER